MKIVKFNEYNSNIKEKLSITKIDILESLVNKIDKDFIYQFSAQNVFCFVNEKQKESLILFDQDSYLDLQKDLKKSHFKEIDGYIIYKIKKQLVNPFFNNDNQYLESHFYFKDNNHFNKIQYFLNKILKISEELNHYPVLEWDSNRLVKIKLFTHKTNSVTDIDFDFAQKIANIWNNIK